MFEVGIGGDFAATTVEGDEPAHGDPGGEGKRQAEDEGIPIRTVGLAWQGQETDAADVSAEDGQADGPTRDAAAGGHELVRSLDPAHEPATIGHHTNQVDADHGQVDDGEGIIGGGWRHVHLDGGG